MFEMAPPVGKKRNACCHVSSYFSRGVLASAFISPKFLGGTLTNVTQCLQRGVGGRVPPPPRKPLVSSEVPPEFTRLITSPAALRLLDVSAGLMACTSRARRVGDGGDRREGKCDLQRVGGAAPRQAGTPQVEPHTSTVASVFLKCAKLVHSGSFFQTFPALFLLNMQMQQSCEAPGNWVSGGIGAF